MRPAAEDIMNWLLAKSSEQYDDGSGTGELVFYYVADLVDKELDMNGALIDVDPERENRGRLLTTRDVSVFENIYNAAVDAADGSQDVNEATLDDLKNTVLIMANFEVPAKLIKAGKTELDPPTLTIFDLDPGPQILNDAEKPIDAISINLRARGKEYRYCFDLILRVIRYIIDEAERLRVYTVPTDMDDDIRDKTKAGFDDDMGMPPTNGVFDYRYSSWYLTSGPFSLGKEDDNNFRVSATLTGMRGK